MRRIIAAGGLEVHGVFGLLRSVVVIPEYQRHGFARSLCDTIINQASQLNLSAVYLLTETAERYFTKLDFAIVPRENAPIDIRNTQEFKETVPRVSNSYVLRFILRNIIALLLSGAVIQNVLCK